LGQASFIVTASDLQPVHVGNVIIKFADDTYIIVPAVNFNTATSEITQVQIWAEENNLTLNCMQKSKKIIFTGRGTRNKSVALPATCIGINQVHSLTALGVVLNDKLTAADYVSLFAVLLASCESFAITDFQQRHLLMFSVRYNCEANVYVHRRGPV